jgi:hypothetical protein
MDKIRNHGHQRWLECISRYRLDGLYAPHRQPHIALRGSQYRCPHKHHSHCGVPSNCSSDSTTGATITICTSHTTRLWRGARRWECHLYYTSLISFHKWTGPSAHFPIRLPRPHDSIRVVGVDSDAYRPQVKLTTNYKQQSSAKRYFRETNITEITLSRMAVALATILEVAILGSISVTVFINYLIISFRFFLQGYEKRWTGFETSIT